jgi:thiol-disulfide isomerase/thioredoxin
MSDAPRTASRKALIGFALALVFGAAVMLLFSQSARLLDQGTPAPAFDLARLEDGRRVSLESLGGRVVLLDFWSTSCPPCLRQMEVLESLHRRHRDLVVLGINTEGAPPPVLREFVRQQGGIGYEILLDGAALSEQYRVTALPTIYVIDAEGAVRWSRSGYTSQRELEAVLEPLL